MGLASIEIVMEVENAFGISIPDADAERIRTVGQLARYVVHRLHGAQNPLSEVSCASAKSYYALRRIMMQVLGLDRREIRLRAIPRLLIPYSRRCEVWTAMERAGILAPPLRAPFGIQFALFALAGLVGMLLLLGMLNHGWSPAVFVMWIIIAPAIAVFVLRRSNAFLPAGCSTIADLVRLTWVAPNAPTEGLGLAVESSFLERIRAIVAEVVGMPVDEVSADTRFEAICN